MRSLTTLFVALTAFGVEPSCCPPTDGCDCAREESRACCPNLDADRELSGFDLDFSSASDPHLRFYAAAREVTPPQAQPHPRQRLYLQHCALLC